MNSTLLTCLSLLPSAAALLILARHDPKRRRTLDLPVRGHLRAQRQLLAALVLLPGVVLGLFEQWPALLMWLGLSLSLGWGIVQLLAYRAPRLETERREQARAYKSRFL